MASRLRARPARAPRHAARPRSSSRSTSRARRARRASRPAELGAFIARCPVKVAGLMTMPPFTEDPEASRPAFAALRELAQRARSAPPLDGHIAGLPGRGRGGRDDRAAGHELVRVNWLQAGKPRSAANPIQRMAFRDTWHRTLVYFGLAEDRDTYDDEPTPTTASPRQSSRTATASGPNVRRLSSRRRRDEIDDIFADDAPSRAPHGDLALGRPARLAAARQRPRRRPRAPRDPQVLQRRPGRGGQVQGPDPGDHQPPGRPTPTSPSA